ncbi:endonuclease-reverse transcriptase [Elysia marginata]|uniref:Endonuclease-reverse transcriptase n=1 Tax=Elysia marginata TaxID=1093978 RepID=A0AAV4E9V5_9GAST|nr:endonuclease-reverse transcriptase [Elysia marginata]
MSAMCNLTSKFDNISKSMSDLNHSVKDLNSKYCTLQTQLQDATNLFRRLEDENRDLKERLAKTEKRLDNMEGQSRRANLIFHGVKQNKDRETWDDCEALLKTTIKDRLGLDSDLIQFERVHRLRPEI